MTALPLRDFTDAQRAKLAAIEAAPAAAESVRERVADALWAVALATVHMANDAWPESSATEREQIRRQRYLRLADAALAVLSGPSSGAERAVARVAGVIAFIDECAVDVAPGRAAVYHDLAQRLRAAVAGES